MRRTKPLAAALTALALLAGCGGDDEPSASPTTSGGATTTTAAATTTTRSAESLRAALLQPGDVPGANASPSSESDAADLGACFPGNPIAAKDHPSEVSSQDFNVVDGSTQRQYSSSGRIGTPDQARDFVTKFGSTEASTCILNEFKTSLAAPPNPVDASAVTIKADTATVADAGSRLTLSGNLVEPDGTTTALAVELIVFHKGPTAVFLSAGAFGGPVVPGQGLELARKIAGRL